MIHERENLYRPDCEVKRRKLEQPQGISAQQIGSSVVATKGRETLFDSNNGTITPFRTYQEIVDVEMTDLLNDCPCGRFHGPGQGYHDDLTAVGLSEFPLLRGPD